MAGQLPLVPLPLTRARSAADAGEARNVRQRVEMPPAPTPASLAAMPPQVVEVLVEQAALAAQDAPNPPVAICEWMKAFCVASGPRACPDDLFRRALNAWGFVPKEETREVVLRSRNPESLSTYENLRGEPVSAPAEVAPPAWAGFDSWRSLFTELCEAWYGRRSRPHPDYKPQVNAGSMWIDATRRLNRYRPRDQAEIDKAKARFVKPDMSQREKDTLLDSLLTHVEMWVGAVADESWHSMDRAPWQNTFDNWRDHKLKHFWNSWRDRTFLDEPNYFRHEHAPWRAVAALLTMRGARLFVPGGGRQVAMRRYEEEDKRLYQMVVVAQRGDVYVNEEFLANMRDTLELAEADPNPDRDLLERWGLLQPNLPPGAMLTPWPPPLIVAIYARSGPLVKLLLEFGATSSFVGPYGLMSALLGSRHEPGNLYWPGWTVDEEDSLAMLRTLREEIEKLGRDLRADRYDGTIRSFVALAQLRARRGGPPVPPRILAAVEAMHGPGPTPSG